MPIKPFDLDGILVIDKEKGWTSHDVCAFVKSRFQLRKVGHAGTLDPLATGILVVLLGRSTKKSSELSSCDKDYYGTLQLGLRTDSQDITGKVTEQKSWEHVTQESLKEAFRKFTGSLEQTPPMVSALKHKGVRLYQLARAGKVVDRQKRLITVHELRIEEIQFPFVRFFAHVSKGTYLRTLVNDIGDALGCCAVLTDLRRVRSGSFSLEDAVPIADLKKMDHNQLKLAIRKPSVSVAIG